MIESVVGKKSYGVCMDMLKKLDCYVSIIFYVTYSSLSEILIAGNRSRGNEMRNVDPFCNCESNSIFPPCCWTIFLVINKPKPVPPKPLVVKKFVKILESVQL